MRKASLFIGAIVLLLAPLAADIVVTSPNGGEPPLAQGTKWMISWTAANVTQQVRILLIKGAGGKFGTIKEPLEPGASPWEWTVGETDAGMAPAGEYKIRITTLDGSKGDISDGNFTITPGTTPPPPPPPGGPPSLTVTSPNGGEPWINASLQNITWTAANFDGAVDLLLKKFNAQTQKDETIGTIASKLPAAQGAHPWTVGSLLNGKPSGIGGGYKVRVVKNYEGLFIPKGKPLLADESDNAFSIRRFSPDDLKKELPPDERTFAPTVQNCHFILQNTLGVNLADQFGRDLWERVPKGLANVGFFWYQSGNLPKKRHDVWNSWVRFYTGLEYLGRKVLDAKLIIQRKWSTDFKPKGSVAPGISYPCLAGVVLLDYPPPCESGEEKLPRHSVPPPSGTVVPISESGEMVTVDVTQYMQQALKLETDYYGFLLYAGLEQDAPGGCTNDEGCCIFNAACFDVSLNVKFARVIVHQP